jgi:hypothetical protein
MKVLVPILIVVTCRKVLFSICGLCQLRIWNRKCVVEVWHNEFYWGIPRLFHRISVEWLSFVYRLRMKHIFTYMFSTFSESRIWFADNSFEMCSGFSDLSFAKCWIWRWCWKFCPVVQLSFWSWAIVLDPKCWWKIVRRVFPKTRSKFKCSALERSRDASKIQRITDFATCNLSLKEIF